MKIILIIFFFVLNAYPQNDTTLQKLKDVVNSIDNSTKNLPIKITWNWMPIDSALSYNIYYCAANDTTIMPIKDGANIIDIWDWQTGSTIYNYYWVRRPSTKYLRIGIIGVNQAGKTTVMKCKTYGF